MAIDIGMSEKNRESIVDGGSRWLLDVDMPHLKIHNMCWRQWAYVSQGLPTAI